MIRSHDRDRGARPSGRRTGGWMHDLRFAMRGLRRRPGFTTVAILTFALGIGANAAIFSIVHALLMQPLAFDPAGRLVRLWEAHPERGLDLYPVAPAKVDDWRRATESIEILAAYRVVGQNLLDEEGAERIRVALVTPGVLEVLGTPVVTGRRFGADDFTASPRVAVVSEGFWVRRGGGRPEALATMLDLEGQRVRVVGVLPDPVARAIAADVFLPFTITNASSRAAHGLDVVGRLRDGADVADAQREMETVARRLAAAFPDTDRGWTITVRTLHDHLVGDFGRPLLMLQAAVALILLTAGANVAGLLLGRAAERKQEVAVRIAMGASRGRILRLLVTEGLILALGGALVGTITARAGLAAIIRLAPAELTLADRVAIDGTVLAMLVALAATMGCVFGLAPARHALRVSVGDTLRDGGRAGASRQTGRRVWVVAQLSATVVLLAGALLFVQSFAALRAVDPGFRPDRLLTALLRPSRVTMNAAARTAFYTRALERVRALPGVTSAAHVSHLPLSGEGEVFRFLLDDRAPDSFADIPTAEIRAVSPQYFETMGVRVVRGRDVAVSDSHDAAPIALINRTMARQFWPDRDPLLRSLSIDGPEGPWRTIVGIVDDIHHFGLDRAPRAEVYLPAAQLPWPTAALVVRARDDLEIPVASIAAAVRSVDPAVPVERIQPMNAYLAAAGAGRRFEATVLVVFATSALVLALVGVYGVLNYSVAQRTKEFGIRMALGAGTGSVVHSVLREGMTMATLGIAIGVTGAVAASRAVAGLLFAVEPLNVPTFAAVAGLVAVTVGAAAYLPAWRASRVDPITSLRAE